VEAGIASLDSEAEEVWGLDGPGYLAAGIGWPTGRRFGCEVRLARIGGSSEGGQFQDVRIGLLEFDVLFRPEPNARVRLGFGGGVATFWAQGDEVTGETVSPLDDLGVGCQAVADLTIPVGRGRFGVRATYQVATDIITVDYSNLRLGLRAGWAF